MSDHTRLIEQVAARNPVPNLDDPPIGAWDVQVVRARVTERDQNMLTDERPIQATAAPIPGRRSSWLVAVASFAIIVLAAGGLWLAGRGSGPGDVAGQPPTTNVPSNEAEQVALQAMVAFFTFDEVELLGLANTPNADIRAIVTRELRHERALNIRADSVTCTAPGPANATVNCQFSANSDLLAALGIEGHPMEANIAVRDGGWTDIFFERNVEASPTLDAFLTGTDSGLFEEGGLCFWRPNIDVSAVDWDACAAAFVALAESWAAGNG